VKALIINHDTEVSVIKPHGADRAEIMRRIESGQ
jgi:hypothetical protein